MDRRIGGIVVIAVAVLAVLVVLPAVGGRGTPGVAVRSPAPVVGDCLTGVTPTAWPPGYLSATENRDAPMDLPTGELGNCDADGAARVIAVSYGMQLPARPTLGEYNTAVVRECGSAIDALLTAWTEAGQFDWRRGDVAVGYQRAGGGDLAAALAGPAGDSGTDWAACYLQVVQYYTSGGPTAAVVGGTVDADRPPAELGVCTNGVPPNASTPDDVRVSCADPHTTEVLGRQYMYGGDPQPADYRAACRAYAADQTGRSDPTAGGALVIRSEPEGAGGPPACTIAVADPSRSLAGSLIGIGDAPLPWAG